MITSKRFSEKQLELFKEVLEQELVKRGISAKIKKFEESYDNKIVVESEKFQTVPAVACSMHLTSKHGGITRHDEEIDGKILTSWRVYLLIMVEQESFLQDFAALELLELACSIEKGATNKIFSVRTA